MNFFEKIPLSSCKSSTPDIWIRRIVLLEQITPKPKYIRDIILKRGLNIIWAEEPEAEESIGDIAGHSAGKTTLCRLIRYILGEKTFSNKSNTKAIKEIFPGGYVAAEIYIKGALFAIMRPLGENRHSYILPEGTIEQIIKDKGKIAYLESYPKELKLDELVENFATSTVVRTNEPIQWGHILAWCTRDQEARFQNIYDWRSPRSESESPAFRFPKSDPLFVMRVALGLFLPDELKSEETLAKLMRGLSDTEDTLERAKREPEYWRDHLTQKLKEELLPILPNDKNTIKTAPLFSDGLFPDLKRLTDKAIYAIEEERSKDEEKLKPLAQSLSDLKNELSQTRNIRNELQILSSVDTDASRELETSQNEENKIRNLIENKKFQMCVVGRTLFSECSHIKNRLSLLGKKTPTDVQLTKEELVAREKDLIEIQKQITIIDNDISSIEGKILTAEEQYDDIKSSIDTRNQLIKEIKTDFVELKVWTDRANNPRNFEKLRDMVLKIDDLKSEIDERRKKLDLLISEHDENRELLSKIFSASTRSVLPSSSYDGIVKFEDRELCFQIAKKGTMSGEAIETLAVLLGDISCLIYNTISKRSYLPGLMIHDSPREADLGLRLYHNYIQFAAKLDSYFSFNGGCPFQYILTTTTPPPQNMRNSDLIRLQLDAAKEDGLLFKKDLSTQRDNNSLQLSL